MIYHLKVKGSGFLVFCGWCTSLLQSNLSEKMKTTSMKVVLCPCSHIWPITVGAIRLWTQEMRFFPLKDESNDIITIFFKSAH